MDTNLIVSIVNLTIVLGRKHVLTKDERQTYYEGLRFIHEQYKMYNYVLERGVNELTKSEKGDSPSDFDITGYRKIN